MFYTQEQYNEAQIPQATPTDARREYADNVGRDNTDMAWISTPWDTWEPNPHYAGPPVRHPEDDDYEDVDWE
jgi:hypothetical protein